MEKPANSLDCLLDIVPTFHPLQSYLTILKVEGKFILVGVASKPLQFDSADLILWKKTVTGSYVGSMEKSQELLGFWGQKGLTSVLELVKIDYESGAFEKMERNDTRCRFVLDVGGSSSNLG
ncbi:hypothetical protein WN943_021503 [Citrus x changshan-huyou]